MKIAILGFGREGQSVLKFLRKNPLSKKDKIYVLDKNPALRVPKNINNQLGKNYLRNLSRFDIVFRSPGIPYNLPELVKARKAGVRFLSVTKLFFSAIGGSPPEADAPLEHAYRRRDIKVIGVTGTKGKGTTSTLIYKILKAHSTSSGQAAGKKVFLAGNIGKSALDILPKLNKNSWVILELSSFQLQDLNISPHIAVVLDVFPDHQDSHKDLKEYYGAKANIARYQKPNDLIFFFKNNRLSRWVAQKSRGRKIAVSEKKFSLFKQDDLKIKGTHNFRNAVMAATVARTLGISQQTILYAVKNFRGLEHRLEFIRSITIQRRQEKQPRRHSHILENVRMNFYNDSASTNPHTAAAAIKAFPGEPKILIAGGYDKGLNYKPLAQALSAEGGSASGGKDPNVKLVVLFGQNKRKIKRQIAKNKVQIVLSNNLKSAVKLTYQAAIRDSRYSHKFADSHYVIIFSPGAASFDQFQNYADRGEQFRKIVLGLTKNIN